MKIVIVGGGIGGLAAAVGLSGAGHNVAVLEQADSFREVGSGLSVWPNAVRAMEALGLGKQLRERSRPARGPVIRDTRGRRLARTDVGELERRFGPLLMVHRADLLEVLRSAVPDGVLHPGARVTSVSAEGTVTHSGGVDRAELVIGADGIGSIVRTTVWPRAPRPRHAGYSAYRMITRPIDIADEGEAWGRGERFGYAPLPNGRVYCFAAITEPRGIAGAPVEELRQRFAGWHAPVPDLLDAVPADAVLHHDLFDLPRLATFVSGRVALLGDAAHAMTPNLGQGAGQALEDAVTLAASLTTHRSLPAALARYDEQRRHRTQSIATRSRRIGAVAQWHAAPLAAVRDRLLRLTPDRSVLRSLAPVLSWQPPTIS